MKPVNLGELSYEDLLGIKQLLDQGGDQYIEGLALMGLTLADLEEYKTEYKKSSLITEIFSKTVYKRE